MNRNIKTLNAIMQNWDVVQNTIMDANNAAGTALEGNALYMDSIEGRITQFNSALQQLSSVTINSGFIKFIVSAGTTIVNLTTSMGGLVPVLGTVIGLFVAFNAEKLASGFSKLGTAFKSMFGVVNAGTSKMASGIAMFGGWAVAIAAAIAVISGISNAVDNAKKKIQEQSATAKNEWQEEAEKAESLNTELENTKKIIEELDGKDSLTVIEQDQLERAKEENAELQKQIDLQNELIRIKEKEARNAAVTAIDDKGSDTHKEYSSWKDRLKTSYGYTLSKGVSENIDISDLSDNPEYVKYRSVGDGNTEVPVITYAGYAEANKRALPELKKQLEEARRLQSDNLEEIQAEYDAALLAVTEYYNYLDEQIGGLSKVTGTNLTEKDRQFNAKYDEKNALGDFLLEVTDASKRTQFDNAVDKFKEEANAVRDVIKDAENTDVELTIDNIRVNAPNLVDQLQTAGWTDEEIVETVKIELAPDSDINLDTDYFADLSSSLFSNTEAYKALTAAMDEQASAGVLSIETYNTLLEQIPELNDLLEMTSEGYALNTEAVYDYIEAQNDIARGDIAYAIQALEDKLYELRQTEHDASDELELQNNIDQLRNLYLATESATGAYKRFLDAQKTPNQDSMYNGVTKAVESVNEGLSSGKIGTDDYRSSLSLLLGGDYSKESGKTVEELTAAGKAAQEISKKYFSDNEIKNITNFRDALLGANEAGVEFASFDGTNFELFDTANVSEVADALGMGEDAVVSLFRLLEAYGADFEWTDLLDKSGFEEVKAEAEQDIKINADDSNVEQETSKAVEEIQNVQETADSIDYSSMNASQLLEEISKIKEEIDSLSASGIEIPIELTGQYENLRKLLSEKGVDIAPWWIKDPSKLIVENTPTKTSHELNLPGLGERQSNDIKITPTVKNGSGEKLINDLQKDVDGKSVEIETEQSQQHELTLIPHKPSEPKQHELTLVPHDQSKKQNHELTLVPHEQNVEIHADTSSVENEIKDSVPDKLSTTVDANTVSANNEISTLKSNAQQTATMTVKADTSSALTKISELANKAKETVTKFIQTKIIGSSNASGTKNATSGMSLVDEKGAELIEHTKSGTFELGTNNGARFTTLDSGDIVHTASETKKILSRAAKIGGFFRDGLNQTKSIIGKAFATGVKGSMSWSLIESITNAVTKKNTSSSSKSSGSSSSSSSSAKKAASNWKSYVGKLFDWVEIRLDRLQTVTDAWLLSAKQAIGYLAKNAELEGALSAVQNQIEATTQAYNKYMAQADAVAKKTGLSAATIKKIQEGSIEIASYSDSAQQKIKAYQEW